MLQQPVSSDKKSAYVLEDGEGGREGPRNRASECDMSEREAQQEEEQEDESFIFPGISFRPYAASV